MFATIRNYFQNFWLNQTQKALIPRFLTERDEARLPGQIEKLIGDLLILQTRTGELSPQALRLNRVTSPYPTLEKAYNHAQGILVALRSYQSMEHDWFTFANQSVPLRDWLTNSEGYYLTTEDLTRWYSAVLQILEILDAQQTTPTDVTLNRSRALLIQFLFRIQDTLIALFQIQMEALALL